MQTTDRKNITTGFLVLIISKAQLSSETVFCRSYASAAAAAASKIIGLNGIPTDYSPEQYVL